MAHMAHMEEKPRGKRQRMRQASCHTVRNTEPILPRNMMTARALPRGHASSSGTSRLAPHSFAARDGVLRTANAYSRPSTNPACTCSLLRALAAVAARNGDQVRHGRGTKAGTRQPQQPTPLSEGGSACRDDRRRTHAERLQVMEKGRRVTQCAEDGRQTRTPAWPDINRLPSGQKIDIAMLRDRRRPAKMEEGGGMKHSVRTGRPTAGQSDGKPCADDQRQGKR